MCGRSRSILGLSDFVDPLLFGTSRDGIGRGLWFFFAFGVSDLRREGTAP